ncbi:MAG: glycosyltransferase family 39 protein, partial [Phycisphaerae bacterium]
MSRPQPTFPRAWLLALPLLLAAAIYNQSAIHWRENLADQHLFEYYGWRVLHGAIPYVDIWDNKPPGIWFANAAAFGIVGENDWPGILIGGGALCITLVAFVLATQWLYGRALVLPAALLASALLTHIAFECGGNRTETLVAATEMSAIAFFLLYLRSRRQWPLILAGLAAGLAPWCKQVGIVAGMCCATYLAIVWWCKRRQSSPTASPRPPLLNFVIAALAPSLLIGGYLALAGALDDAYYAIVKFNRLYFDADDASWTDIGKGLRLYAGALSMLRIPLILATVGVAVCTMTMIRALNRTPCAERGAETLDISESRVLNEAPNYNQKNVALLNRCDFPRTPALFLILAWLILST